jgi:hypothetical protein
LLDTTNVVVVHGAFRSESPELPPIALNSRSPGGTDDRQSVPDRGEVTLEGPDRLGKRRHRRE